jgi:hypothetical protein
MVALQRRINASGTLLIVEHKVMEEITMTALRADRVAA